MERNRITAAKIMIKVANKLVSMRNDPKRTYLPIVIFIAVGAST
jgi:hypothetical protein